VSIAYMFYAAVAFNKPIAFDTGSVNTMGQMFQGAMSFD